ncbi:thioredoxin TrxC [Lysobacter sp. A3-1-A15]|uniref:thioredoxin TrxC n=1 Tax=Novilysobacter viscosus TaxID=3098602 RepID=UPI002EDA8156
MSDPTLEVPCPHCGTVNRVPEDRLAASPSCGRCHLWLFEGVAAPLDVALFDKVAMRGDLPVLVDFWAPWCAPCQAMAPEFQRAASALEPRVRLAKVDTEAVPDLGSRFGIRGIPTLILFRQGREVARQSGAMSQSQIVNWVRAQATG